MRGAPAFGCAGARPTAGAGSAPSGSSENLANAAAEETCGFAFKHPPQPDEAGPLTTEDEKHIALVQQLFKEHQRVS